MATTITSADMTVTSTVAGTFKGEARSIQNVYTASNINEMTDRKMTVPTGSLIELIKFGTANGSGRYTRSNVDYVQATNLDDVNFVRIRVSDTGSHTYDIKLAAGKTVHIPLDMNVSETEAAFVSFSSVDKIEAEADTSEVDIEIVVLSN